MLSGCVSNVNTASGLAPQNLVKLFQDCLWCDVPSKLGSCFWFLLPIIRRRFQNFPCQSPVVDVFGCLVLSSEPSMPRVSHYIWITNWRFLHGSGVLSERTSPCQAKNHLNKRMGLCQDTLYGCPPRAWIDPTAPFILSRLSNTSRVFDSWDLTSDELLFAECFIVPIKDVLLTPSSAFDGYIDAYHMFVNLLPTIYTQYSMRFPIWFVVCSTGDKSEKTPRNRNQKETPFRRDTQVEMEK